MNKRRRKIVVWMLGSAAAFVAAWAGYTQMYEGGLGQPAYEVVATSGEVEFRRYAPFVIASTQPETRGRSGLSNGFRVLAGYIFGGNKPGEKMAMTAPVLQQEEQGESLPMTAPVLRSDDGMRMAFVMPKDRSLSSLPKPNSERVALSRVAWGEVAAIRFRGRGKQERFQKAAATLRAALQASGRKAKGPALYAQYNSPYAFPLLRRNEVLVPLEPIAGPKQARN